MLRLSAQHDNKNGQFEKLNKCRKSELIEEAQVVLEEQADISDALLALRKSFHGKAEL